MKANFKKALVVLLIMVTGGNYVYAQCDKAVTIKSSKTFIFDEEGKLERTKEEATAITISKTEMTIVPGDEDHTITGPITSKTCNWTTPYKDGKMVVKATLQNPNGEEAHATITIVGVDGKVTLTFESEEKGKRKIQVIADKFE